MEFTVCKKCDQPVFLEGQSYCAKHYRDYWYDRWHPDNGWEAMKLCFFECFPKFFMEEYGAPDYAIEIIQSMHFGFTADRPVYDKQNAFFVFREGSKTTYVTAGAAYAAAYNLRGYINYRSASFRSAQKNFMDRFKNMIGTQLYMTVFGDLRPVKGMRNLKDTDHTMVLNNERRTRVGVLGLEQTSRSSVHMETRPDWVIWDDVESDDNSKTPESRDTIFMKYYSEDLPGTNKRTAMVTMVQTPIHPDGLYFKIKKAENVNVIERPIVKCDEFGQPIYDDDGMPVSQWPEKFPPDEILRLEKLICGDPEKGRIIWNREYMLSMGTEEDRIISSSWIRYCKFTGPEYRFGRNWIRLDEIDGVPQLQPYWQPIHLVLGVDPAVTIEGKSCNTGGVLFGTLHDGTRVVIHAFYGKYSQRDVLKDAGNIGYNQIELNESNIVRHGIVGKIFRTCFMYKPDVVAVETIAAFKNVVYEVEQIKSAWYDRVCVNHRMQIRRYDTSENTEMFKRKKIDRISSALRNDHEERRVLYGTTPKRITFMNELEPIDMLIAELVNLGIGSSMDLADAFHIGVYYSERPPKLDEFEEMQKDYRKRTGTYETVENDFVVGVHMAIG